MRRDRKGGKEEAKGRREDGSLYSDLLLSFVINLDDF
jgi:hypothetical protein